MPKILTLTKNILLAVGGVIIALTVLSYIAFYIFEYEAEASFGPYCTNCTSTGPRHTSTQPQPSPKQTTTYVPRFYPYPVVQPIYIPRTEYKYIYSATTSEVKGATTKTATACVNPLPANRIVNSEVPAVVEQAFLEVFNYQINHELSVYWKGRARCDKVTVESLRGAMYFHKAKGLFAPGWKIG